MEVLVTSRATKRGDNTRFSMRWPVNGSVMLYATTIALAATGAYE
ncbi:unannotated protein [freshwater metagenome]|uniref:Unannotated protein n=1 Tax=freshwater metagenome TaxID=449393 RepID=A0A6J6GQQ6_9ZZZZ